MDNIIRLVEQQEFNLKAIKFWSAAFVPLNYAGGRAKANFKTSC